MNKDFWERIDRLEELAGKAMPGRWAYGLEAEKLRATYPDSNRVYAKMHGQDEPAGILVTVNHNLKLSDTTAEYIAAANPAMIQEMIAEIRRLEKEADCLATFLADICDYVADTDCCPVAEASVCPCDKCKDANKPEIWREKARELVELRTEADNA